MALGHSPSIVTSGLTLCYDVGNIKTFDQSLINSTSWSLGSGGATGYSQNGLTSENERVTGTDPFGRSATVWETRPSGDGNADGGWNSDWYGIDNTKLYRFSVWVKRTTATSGGTFYLGLYGSGGSGIRRTDTNAVEGNPYWECSATNKFTQDVWYLVVGHCYPYNTTYTGQHPNSGIYTVAGGPTKVLSINACNIGTDVKWADSAVTSTLHRCYHYYCTDNTTRLQFFDPRIDLIDGTEPTIQGLLSGLTANRLTDLVGTNNGTFANGPTYNSSNGGSIAFDGTDDYVSASNASLIHRTSNWTYSCWVNFSGTPGLGTIFENGTWTNCILIRFETNGITIYSMSTYWGKFTLIPTLGIWYKLDFIRNGNSIDFYLNGSYSQSISFTADIQPSANLFIGMSQHAAGQCFNGRIAQVQIYTRALTAAEVAQNFNAHRARFGV